MTFGLEDEENTSVGPYITAISKMLVKGWPKKRLLQFYFIIPYAFRTSLEFSIITSLRFKAQKPLTEWLQKNSSVQVWYKSNLDAHVDASSVRRTTERSETNIIHWQYVTILLAFIRAHKGHPFQYSVLPLLKGIRQFNVDVEWYNRVEFTEPTIFKETGLDRFCGAKYAQSVTSDMSLSKKRKLG